MKPPDFIKELLELMKPPVDKHQNPIIDVKASIEKTRGSGLFTQQMTDRRN